MSQHLNSYFSGSQELRRVAQAARQLAALQRLYLQLAPPALARASRVEWMERQTLTLAADNQAVAAKLRQLAPWLNQEFRQKGVEVTGILVKVQVGQAPAGPAAKHRTLGSAGRKEVAGLAASLPDSPLKHALQRLAKLRDEPR